MGLMVSFHSGAERRRVTRSETQRSTSSPVKSSSRPVQTQDRGRVDPQDRNADLTPRLRIRFPPEPMNYLLSAGAQERRHRGRLSSGQLSF